MRESRQMLFTPTQKDDVGINVGINGEFLSLIRQNNRMSAKELAESLGISSRQCERIIAELKEQGLLERKGSKKNRILGGEIILRHERRIK